MNLINLLSLESMDCFLFAFSPSVQGKGVVLQKKQVPFISSQASGQVAWHFFSQLEEILPVSDISKRGKNQENPESCLDIGVPEFSINCTNTLNLIRQE